MNKDELQQKYRETIIPLSKNPSNFQKIENSAHQIGAYNPICGDKYMIYVNEDLTEFHFHGHGCALSKASGSILMGNLRTNSPNIDFVDQFIGVVENKMNERSFLFCAAIGFCDA